MEWLAFTWLLLLLALSGWVAASAVSPALIPALDRCSGVDATRRRVWMIAVLPWLVPFLLTALPVALAAAKKWGWLHDHCLTHSPHHPHFCFEHLPQMLLGHPELGIALTVGLVVLALITRHIFYRYRQFRSTRALLSLATGRGRLRILKTDQAVGFAAGIWQPRVCLSSGLLKQLDRRERRIVLAHEVAHIRSGDLRWNALFEWLLLTHVPAVGSRLRSHWRQAMEAKADDYAAARFGRTEVAAALLKLAKIPAASPAPVSAAGGDLVGRVERLLYPQRACPASCFEWVYLVALCGAGMLILYAHHFIETLLGLMPGV